MQDVQVVDIVDAALAERLGAARAAREGRRVLRHHLVAQSTCRSEGSVSPAFDGNGLRGGLGCPEKQNERDRLRG